MPADTTVPAAVAATDPVVVTAAPAGTDSDSDSEAVVATPAADDVAGNPGDATTAADAAAPTALDDAALAVVPAVPAGDPVAIAPMSDAVAPMSVAIAPMSVAIAPMAGEMIAAGYGITSVTLTNPDLGVGEQLMNLTCGWRVPDGSQPGQYFTMTLPPELAWQSGGSFALTENDDGTGAVVADAVVVETPDHQWLVTFTLTNYVVDHPENVNGGCQFMTRWMGGAGHFDTVTVTGTAAFPLGPIDVAGECPDGCAPRTYSEKVMWWNDPLVQSRLGAEIRTKAAPTDGTRVTVIDDGGTGMLIDCATVAYFVVDKDRNPMPYAAPYVPVVPAGGTPEAPWTCSTDKLEMTWAAVPAGTMIVVALELSIEPSAAGLADYTNEGSVEMDDGLVPVTRYIERQKASGTGTGTVSTPTTPPVTTPPTAPTTPTVPTTTPATPATTPAPATPIVVTARATPASPTAVPARPRGATTSTGDGRLPTTGSSATPTALVALLLIAGGAIALRMGRRSDQQV